MEPTIIMSKEFLAALQKEIDTTEEVIQNFHSCENNFELEDYKRYLDELEHLKDWTITE